MSVTIPAERTTQPVCIKAIYHSLHLCYVTVKSFPMWIIAVVLAVLVLIVTLVMVKRWAWARGITLIWRNVQWLFTKVIYMIVKYMEMCCKCHSIYTKTNKKLFWLINTSTFFRRTWFRVWSALPTSEMYDFIFANNIFENNNRIRQNRLSNQLSVDLWFYRDMHSDNYHVFVSASAVQYLVCITLRRHMSSFNSLRPRDAYMRQ